MKTEISDLYTMEEGHILLPFELLNNAKLPNYEYVKYLSNEQGLVVECSVVNDDGNKVLFNYYFDKTDRLMKLIAYEGPNVEVIFNREIEANELRAKISKKNLLNTV
jgi:hypothetical protein